MGHYAAVWDHTAAIEVTKDWNGIEQVMLRNPQGASARVSLQGGQVTSWRNDRGEELLFNSSKSIFKSPKATRGGISVCFPQYGNGGSLEQLGFARNKIWTIEDDPPSLYSYDPQGKSFIDLLLKPSEDDLKFWPHGFEFRVRVTLSSDGSLSLISRIRNINGKQFSFSFAYHTYFSVSDISEIRIEGLETLDYLDNLCQKERFTEQGDAITFESESLLNLLGANRLKGQRYRVLFEGTSRLDVDRALSTLGIFCSLSRIVPKERLFLDMDRVYLSSPNRIAVLDHERKQTYLIRKEGLPDTVVWNPWEKKAKAMADFGDEEYKQMLCVDGAAIEKPITLKPGEEWTGRVELVVVPSSFCDI